MGRKGSWFSSVKKALTPNSKEKRAQKPYFQYLIDQSFLSAVIHCQSVESRRRRCCSSILLWPNAAPHRKIREGTGGAGGGGGDGVGVGVGSDSGATIQLVTQLTGKPKEEVAAIKIQTAFRGHLARRALRALRGLVRLKSLVDGPTVKRQTANTLKCMQTLSRVHSQIQLRRLKMSEENRALQRQLLQKRAKELESLRIGEEWDDSLQSKEQIEASLLQKYEAAMRREKALAYSYTHQQTWKKSSRSPNLLFMDPTNPHWGWSWLERWMAAQPWESQSTAEKELNSDRLSIHSCAPILGFIRYSPTPNAIKPSNYKCRRKTVNSSARNSATTDVLATSQQQTEKVCLYAIKIISNRKTAVDCILHQLFQHGDSTQKYMQGSKSMKIYNFILLDNFVPKSGSSRTRIQALQSRSKRSKKHMSLKQLKKCGSFNLPHESCRYDMVPFNHLVA
ncbi:IQ-DOMAIN 1-like [Olea europaea subsp. europaea]|uniref:IQ-DOMAIN 1-like n=1 Tax=Olea europaea subsp. europaea TaxID=158383 RepID=A0A8S0UVN8_OLEEU|nr:IQ-DOMAIN 1-like [Olea europaea subsp. europaea]